MYSAIFINNSIKKGVTCGGNTLFKYVIQLELLTHFSKIFMEIRDCLNTLEVVGHIIFLIG